MLNTHTNKCIFNVKTQLHSFNYRETRSALNRMNHTIHKLLADMQNMADDRQSYLIDGAYL